MRNVDNASNQQIAKSRLKSNGLPPLPKPEAKGPNSQNDVTDEHGCKPGSKWYTNSYTSGRCISEEVLNSQNAGLESIIDWLGKHPTAQGSICGVVICVAFGPSMVGIGPAFKAGVEVSVGGTTGHKTSGLGVQGSCSAALGPGGVYVDYSRDLAGRQNVGGGYAAGASLGCSGLIVWSW